MAAEGRILLLLILIFSCYFFHNSHCLSDTILKGQQLRDWELLNSPNKVFKLKFFSPSNSKSHYLGIFYNKHPDEEKAVWVANRNNPIPDSSGNLMIDPDGMFKISHSGGIFILTNSTPSIINASATLLDSGNFVLRELNSNGSINRVLWQSFDYPTDTLLPGMKLGNNFKTGHKWLLTSWISDLVPSSGSFTLGINPNGTNQLVIFWQGNICWTTEFWHDGDFNYTSKKDEKYFLFWANKISTPTSYNLPSYTLLYDGMIRESEFGEPKESFNNPGCGKDELPDCRIIDYWFDKIKVYTVNVGFKFDESSNMSLYDCEMKCRNNCSCVAYASTSDNGTGCEIWSKLTSPVYADESLSRDIYILPSQKDEKVWMWLLIGDGIFVFLFMLFNTRETKVKGKSKTTQKMLLYNKASHYKKDEMMSHELRLFSFEDIEDATNNFSSTNKLGQGGFGPVYKGKLIDGQDVAVKRLSRSSGQGLVEFKNEILLIAKLRHANLVRLLGWCVQGEENILVYEYMPNKSLDFFLFDPRTKRILKWTNRFNIIEGIAQGLLYLHKYSRPIVIHRDLKAGNILLDDNLNPKISDFGMAKRFGLNESEANTNRVVGTYGYMAPEYAMKGIVSTKIDVFSFGVLLLEIVSSKKNNKCYHLEHPLNLIGLAWELWKEDRALELIDPSLEDSCPHNEVRRCIHIGLLCVQDHAIDRPSMSDVVFMLKSETTQLPAPKQPLFFIEMKVTDASIDNKYENGSINELTLSKMEAR